MSQQITLELKAIQYRRKNRLLYNGLEIHDLKFNSFFSTSS